MSCKYDIIDEDGRKRVRALRHFTVQGRDVCPMELGGYVYGAGATITPLVMGTLEMKDDAKQVGGTLTIHGDVTLCGGYEQASGALSITGKRTIANVSEIAAVELPPTKTTW